MNTSINKSISSVSILKYKKSDKKLFKEQLKNYFYKNNLKNLKKNKIQSVLITKLKKNINKFKIKFFNKQYNKNKKFCKLDKDIYKIKNQDNFFFNRKFNNKSKKHYHKNKVELNNYSNLNNYKYYNSDYYEHSINKRLYLFSNLKWNLIYNNKGENLLNNDIKYFKNCINKYN